MSSPPTTSSRPSNGSIDECKKDAENTSDNPDSVEVANISVDGDKATADLSVIGGPNDGQKLSASFVKEGDQWRVRQRDRPAAGTDTTATGRLDRHHGYGRRHRHRRRRLTELFFTTIREQVKMNRRPALCQPGA